MYARFHNRYTGMPGLNSCSMPGSATCDTRHKALCLVSMAHKGREHRDRRRLAALALAATNDGDAQ
eukprot:COSAG03_NODE_740_length_6025_cov_34.742491_5_plen_66_part_00